ncbi:MAG: glycosyltransferase family 4 protein [Colwellia sp.]|nr:glycosyltransferase family 4 protein [Colwellia sp.]
MKNTINSAGKVRLIFILEYDSITGGMLHSVTSLIKEICYHFDIFIICPKGQLSDAFSALNVHLLLLDEISLWQSKKTLKRVTLLIKILRLINKNKTEHTVVITNNIYAQLLTGICSYVSSFKTVYFNRGGNLTNGISKLVITLSSHLNLVIATSSNQKNIVEKSGLLKKGAKCHILYNPVENLNLIYETNKNNTFVIGVVGYIDVGKNQLLAIESLALLIRKGLNIQLNIYGEANNEAYTQKLNRRIEQLQLSKMVNFKGFVSNKSKMYSEIDLLLSTSLAEGFGRTLVEAMLERKPVVALHCAGGTKDIITSDDYGQLVDNDCFSVSQAIERFIIDIDYKKQVIQNAYSYASFRFSPKAIAQEFIMTIERDVL